MQPGAAQIDGPIPVNAAFTSKCLLFLLQANPRAEVPVSVSECVTSDSHGQGYVVRVVLVTIIISRHIDRGISNWSVPAVRIIRNRGPYRPGRLGHGHLFAVITLI